VKAVRPECREHGRARRFAGERFDAFGIVDENIASTFIV
jgi:hypothetical protein